MGLPVNARCEELDDTNGGLCGAPATHEYFDNEFGFDVYTCDEHAPKPADPKAPGEGQLDIFDAERNN